MSGELDIRPVGAALGAAVHNIDLNALSDAQATQVEQAFADHLVLFFPGQDLTPAGTSGSLRFLASSRSCRR